MEETYRHRLDIYYISTIGYVVALIVYAVLRGTLSSDGTVDVVWRDPIVYLLAAASIAALCALIFSAWLARRMIVSPGHLQFVTRFRERVFLPQELEWIGFRPERERAFRGEKTYPMIRFKLRDRRRLLRLRPASFEQSAELAIAIRNWAVANNVELRVGRRRRPRPNH